MSANSTTAFISRGRLTGLVRRRASEGEALYYRARLILGDSLPRPVAEPGTERAHGSFERKLPISNPK